MTDELPLAARYEVALFRGEAFTPAGRLPLEDVVFPALERLLGRPLDARARVRLTPVAVLGPPRYEGTPAVHDLAPGFGYFDVAVEVDEHVVYRHPHSLSELVAEPLRAGLGRERPDVSTWGFCLVRTGEEPVLRPPPAVEGAFDVGPGTRRPPSGLRAREVPDPPPPEATAAELGAAPAAAEQASFVKVLLPNAVRRDLCETRAFSREVEEGGFLLGRVHGDREAPGTFLVSVAAALPAEHTGASFLHLTFTPDSFGAVKRVLREERPGEQLLGWYHTHLFPAAEAMGLSSVDLDLHRTTFRKPWQVAGLVNLDLERGTRLLRFYVERPGGMQPCPAWSVA